MQFKPKTIKKMAHAMASYSFLLFGDSVFAITEEIKFRAREHFEIHKYSVQGLDRVFEFKGLTNTLNILYEKPFRYSFGLAAGPVIGSANSKVSSDQFGERVRLWVAGLEGKYFPLTSGYRGFIRLGSSWHKLDTGGSLGSLTGWGIYGGLGWEFPWGRVSIAPEVAFRKVFLEKGVQGTILTPSIGFHFYPELSR